MSVDPSISRLDDSSLGGLLVISRGTAILLLVVYIGYLILQLKTHAPLFAQISSRVHFEESDQEEEEDVIRMNAVAATLWYVYAKQTDSNAFILEFRSLLIITVITSLVADSRE
jgi:Ca2+/H+ antiporter